jgi:riboflavin kinase/FMN adenylyltransferase
VFFFNPHKQHIKQAKAVAIGNFDGLHKGHQALLDKLNMTANKCLLIPTVLTFEPHPKQVLFNRSFNRITSLPHKLMLIKQCKVDLTCVVNFSTTFANMTPEQFIVELLINRINAKIIMVGSDFRFGCNKSGDINLMKSIAKEHNINIIATEHTLYTPQEKYSSTMLRDAITTCNLSDFFHMTGRHYGLIGKVQDNGLLFIAKALCLPPSGTYYGTVYNPLSNQYTNTKIMVEDNVIKVYKYKHVLKHKVYLEFHEKI